MERDGSENQLQHAVKFGDNTTRTKSLWIFWTETAVIGGRGVFLLTDSLARLPGCRLGFLQTKTGVPSGSVDEKYTYESARILKKCGCSLVIHTGLLPPHAPPKKILR